MAKFLKRISKLEPLAKHFPNPTNEPVSGNTRDLTTVPISHVAIADPFTAELPYLVQVPHEQPTDAFSHATDDDSPTVAMAETTTRDGAESHTVAESNLPTVVANYATCVDMPVMATVDTTQIALSRDPDLTTVFRADSPTVDRSSQAAANPADKTTVGRIKTTTVDIPEIATSPIMRSSDISPTVTETATVHSRDMTAFLDETSPATTSGNDRRQGREASNSPTVYKEPTVDRFVAFNRAAQTLWITEEGNLVPHGRVRQIRLAQDVINSAEESVYDTLWAVKPARSDERDTFRIVQAGYDYLGKKTRLSKKTIQRIVDKLIDKDFIKIEQPADIYQRTSTVYRVYAYKTVLERHLLRDRTHVAKIGPGFSYVQPLSEQIAPSAVGRASLTTVANSLMSPVEQLPESTVDKYGAPRVAPHATRGVGRNNVSTVAHGTTNLDNKDLGHQTTPPSKEELAELREELRQFGPIDNAALIHLISECRGRAGDCTIDEIAYFSRQKGKLARSNPIGLILFAVPPLFEVDEHLKIREEVRRQKEVKEQEQVREQRERDEQRRSFQAIINDPTAPEGDKQLAREMMRLLD